MQNKDKGDGIEDSPLDMYLVILLEGASEEVVTPSSPTHPKEVKIDLPHFYGKDNVEVFLDWVAKVEQLFKSHVVEEERRVSLATLSFQGHALNWWTSLVLKRRRKGLHDIEYWNGHKEASYYKRELLDKLQRLQ